MTALFAKILTQMRLDPAELPEVMIWVLPIGCIVMALSGWWCQIWRYPAFRKWTPEEFPLRHAGHTLTISLVVVPGMLAQLAGTAWQFVTPAPAWLAWLHVGLCALSIGPTLVISGPIHGRLSRLGKDAGLIERLIRTNWPRTVVWTAQAVLALGTVRS